MSDRISFEVDVLDRKVHISCSQENYDKLSEILQNTFICDSRYVNRFWEKIDIKSIKECWIWKGNKNKGGYGICYVGPKSYLTHRFSYLITKGPIENGLLVCHICDNPSCVNPNHLFLGTHQDNASDKVSKGRQSRSGAKNPKSSKGTEHGMSKLNDESVLTIRDLYAKGGYSMMDLAKLYSVSKRAIQFVVHRKNWKHI